MKGQEYFVEFGASKRIYVFCARLVAEYLAEKIAGDLGTETKLWHVGHFGNEFVTSYGPEDAA